MEPENTSTSSQQEEVEEVKEAGGDTPSEETQASPEEETGTKFANLEEASKGLLVVLGRLEGMALPEEVNKSLLRHLATMADVCDTLPNKGAASQTWEEANKEAFEASEGLKVAKETAANFGHELKEGDTFYTRLWDSFSKPYSAENPPSPPTYRLLASFEIKEGRARAANGEGQSISSDRKLRDNSLVDPKSRVYYSVLWDAYKKDGPHKDLLTDEEKKAQYYQGGGYGSKFAKRLQEQGLIASSRSFLSDYEKAENAAWKAAGNEGLRFEEATD